MAPDNPMLPFRTEQLLSQQAWLRSLAATLVRDQAERDDLVQEAWLAALRQPQAGEKRDLRQWLGAVLRNRWRFERRSDARRRAREQGRAEREPVPAALDLVERAELQGVLVRAVLALDEPYRSTVLQRYFGERSCRAIARAEGVPEGTVRSRLKRALDQLRAELDRQNGGERRAWVLALVPLARLARSGRSLVPSAAVAAAAVAVLALGWTWTGPGERAPLAISAATSGSPASTQLADTPEDRTRAPAAAEESTTGQPALLTAGHLRILVLDPDGRPIPEASVACGADERRRSLRTGEDGTCRIPDDCWTSRDVELEIEARGFVRHDAPIERGSFTWSSLLPITLPRACVLEGRLRDEDTGHAIAGGELFLLHGYHGPRLAQTTSGADGSFQLEPAPRGWEVELVVIAPGYAETRRLVQVASSGSAFVELDLAPGVELHGRVVDAWTGTPLAGASVFHSQDPFGYDVAPDESSIEVARSDAGGELAFRTLPDEPSRDLLVARAGYCCQAWTPGADGFEVALLPSAAIQGVVRDTAGKPLEGVEMVLDRKSQMTKLPASSLAAPPDTALGRLAGVNQLSRVWRAKSDEAGRFRLEVVPWRPGNRFGYRALDATFEYSTIEEPLPPGGTRDVEITVAPAGTIAGLLRINGQPGPGHVRCLVGDSVVARGWARPDGRFEIQGVPPGRVALLAFPDEFERQGFTPRRARMDPILAEVGVVAGERGAVELDLLLPMGTIRGRVQSPAGLPRAHTTVLARAPENGSWRTVTDAAGAFELRVPAEPPSYELCVLDLAPVPVTVNTDGVELVTPGYGRIRLRAWEANHAVVERVTLYVRRTRPEWASAGEVSAGTNGLAEWELEAGALELAAGKPEDGYPSTFLGGFTLAEDAELELQVLIERVEPVEFVLGNAPLPARCAIGLEAANGLLIQGGTLGAGSTLSLSLREGRASVPGLASDTYRLIASLPDVVVEPAEIRLGADRSRPIELTWHRSD